MQAAPMCTKPATSEPSSRSKLTRCCRLSSRAPCLAPAQDVPYFVQTNSTPDGSALLNTAHTRLINYLEDVGCAIPAVTLTALILQY